MVAFGMRPATQTALAVELVLALASCSGKLVRLGISSPASDGSAGLGGEVAIDVGVVGADAGDIASDGQSSTDSTDALGCAIGPSTLTQTITFDTSDKVTSYLAMIPMPARTGALLGFTTSGPATNPTLCAAGCAKLSMNFAAGMPAWRAISAEHSFSPRANLVGSTVTFTLAIDNSGTPIEIQGYTGDGLSANSTWTQPAVLTGSSLDRYDARSGLQDLSLKVRDNQGTLGIYCAAATGVLGIQLQSSATITAANAGTVTVYVSKIAIQPNL
jgi:hypothetical protein